MKKMFLTSALCIGLMKIVLAQEAEIGMASYYSDNFEGKITASGEIFSQTRMTAAHRTIPFKTKVKVTNLNNDKSIVVIVNDRGPFAKGRIIDLSKKAAIQLDFIDRGVTKVKIEWLNNE